MCVMLEQHRSFFLPRSYPDYASTASGLQYKDFREGEGETPRKGDTVVIDWSVNPALPCACSCSLLHDF